jgi:hypothetical protein
VAIIL